MPGTDDLAPLLVPPPTQAVRFGQGLIRTWNPETFENVIDWNGVRLENLPVLAGTDALTFTPGQTVGLLGWDAGGRKGVGSWWILGRLVLPALGAGQAAVDFMTSELARAVSASVFADQISSDHVATTADVDNTTYGDLSGSPGPEVTVEVGETGRLLAVVSAFLIPPQHQDTGGSGVTFTYMSYALAGPTARSADDDFALSAGIEVSPTRPNGPWVSASRLSLQDGLSAGEYTVTAKYRRNDPVLFNVDPGIVEERTLTVIAF